MHAVLHTEEKREARPIDRDSQSHVPRQLERKIVSCNARVWRVLFHLTSYKRITKSFKTLLIYSGLVAVIVIRHMANQAVDKMLFLSNYCRRVIKAGLASLHTKYTKSNMPRKSETSPDLLN